MQGSKWNNIFEEDVVVSILNQFKKEMGPFLIKLVGNSIPLGMFYCDNLTYLVPYSSRHHLEQYNPSVYYATHISFESFGFLKPQLLPQAK